MMLWVNITYQFCASVHTHVAHHCEVVEYKPQLWHGRTSRTH